MLPLVFAASVMVIAVVTIAFWSTNGGANGHTSAVITEPPPGPDASTGTVEVSCGRNGEGHHNMDNLVTSPGTHDGAHHLHDYVGNLSTDAFSTEKSLAAAATTCTNGDRSVYYWPVLRLLDGAGGHQHGDSGDGNNGTIIEPSSVRITYHGSPISPVVAMPRFLRVSTGDAHAVTNGPRPFARVQWGCSGQSQRRLSDQYPQCPAGEQVTRSFEFPSCWNGLTTDSETHRKHVVFPADNGVCQDGFFAVPALRIELAYDLPGGRQFAIDTFPEEQRSARTDHSDFIDVMTDEQMAHVVTCLNTGQHC